MALIKWRDSYATGMEYFDDQHRKMVDLVNELYEICRDHETGPLVHKVLNETFDYAIYHFSHEERVMETVNYAYVEEHKLLHFEFK